MDYPLLIGSIQLAIAAYQLKLDHFSKASNRQEYSDREHLDELGQAIRTLEYALTETIAVISQTNQGEPNPRIARLWQDASQCLRNLSDSAELSELAFEKNLYWSNPTFYETEMPNKLYRISFNNVLGSLRDLRAKYDRLKNKLE